MSERRWYLGGRAAALMIRAWRLSLRLEVRHHERLEQPCVLALWHGRIFGPLLDSADSGCVTMASQSSDGALAAGILEGLGIRVARGSSSRGGREAVSGMAEAMRAGAPYAALTVDGPRGPWRQVKAGALILARKLRIPIVPGTFSCTRPRLLRSWDSMVLPRPFARVVVDYGDPWPSERLAARDSTDTLAGLSRAIDELTATLDREVAGSELWPRSEG